MILKNKANFKNTEMSVRRIDTRAYERNRIGHFVQTNPNKANLRPKPKLRWAKIPANEDWRQGESNPHLRDATAPVWQTSLTEKAHGRIL